MDKKEFNIIELEEIKEPKNINNENINNEYINNKNFNLNIEFYNMEVFPNIIFCEFSKKDIMNYFLKENKFYDEKSPIYQKYYNKIDESINELELYNENNNNKIKKAYEEKYNNELIKYYIYQLYNSLKKLNNIITYYINNFDKNDKNYNKIIECNKQLIQISYDIFNKNNEIINIYDYFKKDNIIDKINNFIIDEKFKNLYEFINLINFIKFLFDTYFKKN